MGRGERRTVLRSTRRRGSVCACVGGGCQVADVCAHRRRLTGSCSDRSHARVERSVGIKSPSRRELGSSRAGERSGQAAGTEGHPTVRAADSGESTPL
eukprot:758377-Hanusia_phi.AAC.5